MSPHRDPLVSLSHTFLISEKHHLLNVSPGTRVTRHSVSMCMPDPPVGDPLSTLAHKKPGVVVLPQPPPAHLTTARLCQRRERRLEWFPARRPTRKASPWRSVELPAVWVPRALLPFTPSGIDSSGTRGHCFTNFLQPSSYITSFS